MPAWKELRLWRRLSGRTSKPRLPLFPHSVLGIPQHLKEKNMKKASTEDSSAERIGAIISAVIIGLLVIICLALSGFADTAAQEAMEKRANAVARCRSIDGAEWGGDACYYNGVKLNFKEGYDAPEE